jgi:hypothetical protein
MSPHEKTSKVERRKVEKMNQFGIKYIYTWKCYNETPCIDILNKQKFLFSKTGGRKVKQVLSRGWYQCRGEERRI